MTNYRRGYTAENKYVKKLRDEGYGYAQRTAGSHSIVDIWAVGHDDVLAIQMKRGKFNKHELEQFKAWRVPICVTKRFVIYKPREGFITLYEE